MNKKLTILLSFCLITLIGLSSVIATDAPAEATSMTELQFLQETITQIQASTNTQALTAFNNCLRSASLHWLMRKLINLLPQLVSSLPSVLTLEDYNTLPLQSKKIINAHSVVQQLAFALQPRKLKAMLAIPDDAEEKAVLPFLLSKENEDSLTTLLYAPLYLSAEDKNIIRSLRFFKEITNVPEVLSKLGLTRQEIESFSESLGLLERQFAWFAIDDATDILLTEFKNERLVNLKTILTRYPALKERITVGPTEDDKINRIFNAFDSLRCNQFYADLYNLLRQQYSNTRFPKRTTDVDQIIIMLNIRNPEKKEILKELSPACCIAKLLFPDIDIELIKKYDDLFTLHLQKPLYLTEQQHKDMDLWGDFTDIYYLNIEQQLITKGIEQEKAKKIAAEITYFGDQYASNYTSIDGGQYYVLSVEDHERLISLYEIIASVPSIHILLTQRPSPADKISRKEAAAYHYLKKSYYVISKPAQDYLNENINELIPAIIADKTIETYLKKKQEDAVDAENYFPRLPETDAIAILQKMHADSEAEQTPHQPVTPKGTPSADGWLTTDVTTTHNDETGETIKITKLENHVSGQRKEILARTTFDPKTGIEKTYKAEIIGGHRLDLPVVQEHNKARQQEWLKKNNKKQDRNHFAAAKKGALITGGTALLTAIITTLFYRNQRAIVTKMRKLSGDNNIIKTMEANPDKLYSNELEGLYTSYKTAQKRAIAAGLITATATALAIPLAIGAHYYKQAANVIA